MRPPARPDRGNPEGSQGLNRIVPIKAGRRLAFGSLGLLLLFFIALQCLLPLRTAVKIGADEDFELSKATLCMHGYQLYTQIWDDQPPLHTFIITQLLTHVSPSILGPRLLTVGFAMLLLVATFVLVHRTCGGLAATLATGLFIVSPGFIELSSSCMQEIPAFAPVVAGLCVLRVWPGTKGYAAEILGGIIFGFALQMKLIGVIYLPLASLIIWLRHREGAAPLRNTLIGSALFGASCGVSFVALNYLTGNSLWIQLQQSWSAHFAHTRSFEYGSPTDRPFDGSVLLKNWDTTLPALLGIFFFWKRVRRDPAVLLPLVWLVLSLVVFTTHKPWWSYYYVHNSLPLCWCAGAGLAVLWERIRLQPARAFTALVGVYALCASLWAGTRVYLQVDGICKSPQLYSCLVLKEIERFKPFTTFLFADEPIYSFHAGIPMPPRLAMISLKRLWAGELDNAGIVAELEVTRPGLILITSPGRALPFQDLLEREYRRVYRDDTHHLYAHQSISRKAR